MKTQINYTFEITNTCTCVTYDENTGDFIEAPECWSGCWEEQKEDLLQITEHLWDSNETDWWHVTGLRLWNGETGGYFYADTIDDLIEGMTVRSEWIMRGTVYDDRIEYSLSHHDAPTGSNTTLTPVTEEQREELGL